MPMLQLSLVDTPSAPHQGVLLPSLGNFRVGPVVGENSRKVRPSFRLLEGRYGSISQEQSKYIVGESWVHDYGCWMA